MAEDKKEVVTEQQNVESNGDKKTENGDPQVTNGTNGTEEANVEPPKEMRSIVNSGRSIKVLKKPEPIQPGDGEVLIRVQSA